MAVTEALLVLIDQGAEIGKPYLTGQRFEVLARTLEATPENTLAVAAMHSFRRHERLRPYLSHGVGKLALGRDGDWMLALRVLNLRGHAAECSTYVVEEAEAANIARELGRDATRLEKALVQLRQATGGAT